MPHDRFDLVRFRTAQAPIFETALAELRAGRKRSHWMWFIFPQLRGLGRSSMANHYGIASIQEARTYFADPVLGERLRMTTEAVLAVQGRSAREILGVPDDLKFRSSMTLFAEAANQEGGLFRSALERYFQSLPDKATLALLRNQPPP